MRKFIRALRSACTVGRQCKKSALAKIRKICMGGVFFGRFFQKTVKKEGYRHVVTASVEFRYLRYADCKQILAEFSVEIEVKHHPAGRFEKLSQDKFKLIGR